MTTIIEGMTPAEFLSAVNANFLEIYGEGLYTTIADDASALANINTNFSKSVVSFGMKSASFCNTLNNEKGQILRTELAIIETDDLYYKYDTLHIDTSMYNYALLNKTDRIWISADGGDIYDRFAYIPDLGNKLQFSRIFRNGKVIFGTNTKAYQTDVTLSSIVELPITESDGVTPLPIYLGANFNLNNVTPAIFIDGRELFIMSNYGNFKTTDSPAGDGTNETNVFAIFDDETVLKSVYKFGQNANYKEPDNTPIGDAGNSVICRHGHAISFDESTQKLCLTTGDSTNECHIMEGTYNSVSKSFAFDVLYSGGADSWFKVGGENVIEGYRYFSMDSDSDATKYGIYKCLDSDRGDNAKYTKLHTLTAPVGNPSMITDDIFIGRPGGTRSILISKDRFATLLSLSLTTGIDPSILFWRHDTINNYGWIRIEASTTRSDFTQGTLWIKLK